MKGVAWPLGWLHGGTRGGGVALRETPAAT
jgi:hypothetical protein